jgi:hypothetical protein
MIFRLKALGWHVFASTCLLLLIVGALYLGWYRWPGWYLAAMPSVLPIMVGVDVVLGPFMTFIIANPGKPRRVLARDIGTIVVVQLVALAYGSTVLWQGRPLYYVYSGKELSIEQPTDFAPEELALAEQQNPQLAPHWNSSIRWVYTPLPPADANGKHPDLTAMPRYFQPWVAGLPDLRKKLKKVDDWPYFSRKEQALLKQRLVQHGFAADDPATMPMTGRDRPLLAVFDPETLELKDLIRSKP